MLPRAASMLHTRCRVPVLLAALLLALQLLPCSLGQTWDFRDAQTKTAAATTAKNDAVLPSLVKKSITAAEVSQLTSMFNNWAAHFNKSFSPLQMTEALDNFKQNMQLVFVVNTNTSLTFWLSGNQFSHLSSAQFKSQFLGKAQSSTQAAATATATATATAGRRLRSWSAAREGRVLASVPTAVDWVQAGKVADIKNQKQCGSCWAFAATSAVESMHMIKVPSVSRSQVVLSEEELVDCCSGNNYGCQVSGGCDGGLSNEAINFIARAGQTTSANYPYTSGASGVTGSCKSSLVGASPGVQLSGQAVRITANSEAALMQAVSVAPTVIYFDAENSFQNYAGGVYSGTDCGTNTNHAMVAVGYSTSGSQRYWLIRNHWSTSWGEAGYIRVAMTGNSVGMCGMYQESYQPPQTFTKTLAGNGPTPNPTPNPTPVPTPKPSPVPTPSPSGACSCTFPFTYKSKVYTQCTTVDDTKPWCIVSKSCTSAYGTTANSSPPGLPYIYCSNTPAPTPTPTPQPADPCACIFPFKYKSITYSACTTVDDSWPWCVVSSACSTAAGTTSYTTPANQAYKYCSSTSGSGQATAATKCPCAFPFSYNGASYSSCTTADSPDYPWCFVDASGGLAPTPDNISTPHAYYMYTSSKAVCYVDGAVHTSVASSTSQTLYYNYC